MLTTVVGVSVLNFPSLIICKTDILKGYSLRLECETSQHLAILHLESRIYDMCWELGLLATMVIYGDNVKGSFTNKPYMNDF